MPTSVDPTGVWNYLGTVTPVHNQWIKFPLQASDVNPSVRLKFTCDNWLKVNSWAWFRVVFEHAQGREELPSQRVYPRDGRLLLQCPIPSDFLERGISFRSFEIMKKLRWRRHIGITPDVIWQVTLEELWG